MLETDTGWVANGAWWARPRRMRITVRVWRRVAGAPQVLYTFAGSVDAATLRDVLRQVRRLINAAPGGWRIQFFGAELDDPLRGDVAAAIREQLDAGNPSPLTRATRPRPELCSLLTRTALLP
jgi:hypothetical protein